MKTPIVVYDKGDVMMFDTAEAAELYIEPHDAVSYVAYDADGWLLSIIVNRGRVIVSRDGEAAATHAGKLRLILIDFLSRSGVRIDALVHSSLDVLLAETRLKLQAR